MPVTRQALGCSQFDFYLWSCGQRGAQRVLHGLRQDGGALPGHHRHQAAVLGEKHRQVGAAASSTNTITCIDKEGNITTDS